MLFAMVMLLIMPSAAKDKRRNMAFSVLRRAREAHQAGRYQEAQNLLAKARFIWKDLPDPGWSLPVYQNQSSPKISADIITRESGNKLLFEFLAKPTPQGKKLLDVYITKFPDETLIKEQFIAKARLSGLMAPEEKIMIPDSLPVTNAQAAKLLLLIVIVLLAVWQTVEAIKEIRANSGRLK